MPKYVEMPGGGLAEFPDAMPDAQIEAALAAQPAAAPERGNLASRAYSAVAEPVTRGVSAVADQLTEPLVALERVRIGEPVSQVLGSPSTRTLLDPERFRGPVNPLAKAIVPQTLIEAGAMAGTIAAGPLAPLARAVPALGRALMLGRGAGGRVAGGAVGGEVGGEVSGETPGLGALIGGGSAALGEVLGRYVIEPVRRMLPGAKKAISLDDTRRVGQNLADVTGAPPMRTPADILDATTGAATRKTEMEAANEAALVAHREAVTQARAEAARLTREGRAAQAAEWQTKQRQYQAEVDRLEEEARGATTALQGTVDAMARAVNARRRAQAAESLQDTIVKAAPQLAPVLKGRGAEALRGAGAGGARKQISAIKEEQARVLAEAAPEGVRVPSLAPPTTSLESSGLLDARGVPLPGKTVVSDERIPIREALEDLSLLYAGRSAQFSRNPLDRTITGAEARRRAGQVHQEIRQALREVDPRLVDVFDKGQQETRDIFAVAKTVLEPNASWKTGALNVPGLKESIGKPRMETLYGDRRADLYEQIKKGVGAMPEPIPRQHAPRIEPTLPEPPVKPPPFQAVEPTLPAEPVPAQRSAADVVMTALFGPQNRLQQGRDMLVNWPAVQKTIQAPRVRAEIEALPDVGPEGYQQILRSVLRGATEGADVPAAGSGRFAGPLIDWLSGREKGAGFMTMALPRSFVPNAGAYYVGRKPLPLPPQLQAILDVALQRAGGAGLEGRR